MSRSGDLRKTITAELSKGESRNSLVRVVNLHRLGCFRDRIQDDLSIRACALNLVASIIHGNAINTGRVVEALYRVGQHVPDHLLSSLSAYTWEHVSFTGDYIPENELALDDSGSPLMFRGPD